MYNFNCTCAKIYFVGCERSQCKIKDVQVKGTIKLCRLLTLDMLGVRIILYIQKCLGFTSMLFIKSVHLFLMPYL